MLEGGEEKIHPQQFKSLNKRKGKTKIKNGLSMKIILNFSSPKIFVPGP